MALIWGFTHATDFSSQSVRKPAHLVSITPSHTKTPRLQTQHSQSHILYPMHCYMKATYNVRTMAIYLSPSHNL
jgi:hypothetical protein